MEEAGETTSDGVDNVQQALGVHCKNVSSRQHVPERKRDAVKKGAVIAACYCRHSLAVFPVQCGLAVLQS